MAKVSDSANSLFGWVWLSGAIYVIGFLIYTAYEIRMGAINEFGAVIHEFDPYFNFRATEVSFAE
jgi:dolichyl-diphosphooligosaccharide--protein glycosyltransferase